MAREITQEEFRKMLPLICDAETSADPDGWTPENPVWGHCAVVSLLAQDFFGGTLLRASLKETLFKAAGSHYWNKLEDGTEVDFTAPQFGNQYPVNLSSETRERAHVLLHPQTKRRYELLALRVRKTLNELRRQS
ncbi:hypothetical protein KGQ34_01150 [Patescibacteria group bacterium]|nr:hypothetical protein [Patescibacteria group bacterium]